MCQCVCVCVCVCPKQVYVWLNLLCGSSQCHAMIKRQHWNKGKKTFSIALRQAWAQTHLLHGWKTDGDIAKKRKGRGERKRETLRLSVFCLMKSHLQLYGQRDAAALLSPFLSLFLSIIPGSSSAYWSLLQPLFLSFSVFGSATLSSSYLWKTRFRLRVIKIIQF